MTDSNQLIDVYTYTSDNPGRSLLILGAIHGNEHCGTIAIERLIDQLESRELKIEKGSVTLIPICNPEAYKKNVRQTEDNLNRMFHPENKKETYEARLAREISPYIQKADFLIDLHSMTTSNDVFMFKSVQNSSELDEFARCLGVTESMSGWDAIYDVNNQRCTDDYAREIGTLGVCIECGQHESPKGPEVAYTAIINSLKYFEMIPGAPDLVDTIKNTEITQLIMMERSGSFTKEWSHGDSFESGEVIARYDDGEEIYFDKPGVIILPKPWACMSGEWFYIGNN